MASTTLTQVSPGVVLTPETAVNVYRLYRKACRDRAHLSEAISLALDLLASDDAQEIAAARRVLRSAELGR